MEKLFSNIDELKEKYLSFLIDICKIESKSIYKDAVNRVNDAIEAFAKTKGFSVTRYPFNGSGDYMTIDLNEGAEKGYAFLAHTDTVHEPGIFGEEVVKIENDRLIGPGVIDCKGGITVALLAMEALKLNGYTKHIRLICVADEEHNSSLAGDGGNELIAELALGFAGVFCCEIGVEGEICIGRKGILHFDIEITGIPAHAGLAYFNGASAVREAAHKIIEIEKHSQDGGTTYNCGRISGGGSTNIVPEYCKFAIDVRVCSGEAAVEARRMLNEITDTVYVSGTKAKLIESKERPPLEADEKNKALFEKVRIIGEKYKIESVHPITKGGGADSAYTSRAGIPTVCSMGTIGDFAHTANEYMEIPSLARRAKLLAATIVS